VALAATAFVVVPAVVAIGSVVAVPVVLTYVGLGRVAELLIDWLRWPRLAAMVLVALAALYRFGSCRCNARWQWITWGSAVALTLWLTASFLFSCYVGNFGSYSATEGQLHLLYDFHRQSHAPIPVISSGKAVNTSL